MRRPWVMGLGMLAVFLIDVAASVPADSQLAGTPTATAGNEIPALHVAVFIAPPFVMNQNGSLTGFSIELWNAIAARLGVKTSYQIAPGVDALENAIQDKRVDLTVAPIFITAARDEKFDFTYPIVDAGLQVMVRDTGEGVRTVGPLWDLVRLLTSRTTAVWLGIAFLLVLIPAHLIWLIERRRPDGIISSPHYFPGICEAFYWAVSTLLTSQASAMPREWMARIFSIYWMFAGVVFVAFYTAQLTTTLTVEQIRGPIEGPSDLPGKPVAAIAHSTAADYLREHGAEVKEFTTSDQMFEALLDKKVDAVVSNAPILLYYAAHEGKGRVKMVGAEFNNAPIAILLHLDSPLRRKVDRALLALRENGTYWKIYDKWFGEP